MVRPSQTTLTNPLWTSFSISLVIDGAAMQSILAKSFKGNRINLIIDFIENDLGLSLMMEKMVRPFEGKQIVDIETESLMVLMKLKINISEAVQQFWQEMQEKYAKKD